MHPLWEVSLVVLGVFRGCWPVYGAVTVLEKVIDVGVLVNHAH